MRNNLTHVFSNQISCHQLFLRGRPALTYRMKRQKVKGTGHKQPADANTEPNFYAMPPVQTSPPYKGNKKKEMKLAPVEPPARPLPEPPTQVQVTLSPGIGSVHGAARLLRGIATGQRFVLPTLPFVGLPPAAALPSHPAAETSDAKASAPSSASRSTSYRDKKEPPQKQRGNSFLPQRQES